jgi:hypothetical protein
MTVFRKDPGLVVVNIFWLQFTEEIQFKLFLGI